MTRTTKTKFSIEENYIAWNSIAGFSFPLKFQKLFHDP